MARPLRIEFEDAIYHLTAPGNERQRVFREEYDREQFLTLLARSCERYEVSVLVFVLMGNHFHLGVQTHRGNLSRWMHWLMVSYRSWFNWRRPLLWWRYGAQGSGGICRGGLSPA